MNVLIVALPYHHYTDAIAQEFERAGHRVALHSVQPRDFATKALRNLSPARWQKRLTAHHERVLRAEAGKHYDLVLFIQVHQVERPMFERFRREFSGARFVLYNWDSIDNHDYRPYIPDFDAVFTFDPADAARENLHYLPLFCVRDFQALRKDREQARKIYLVGNLVNLARYDAIRTFADFCAGRGMEFDTHLAATPPILLSLLRSGRSIRGVKRGAIGHQAFIDMLETSAATFDFANHRQTGYTMRVIENLCAGKKIITNNPRVAGEPFFSPDRFFVYRGDDFAGVEEFLDTPLERPEENFPAYHIQAFVDHLIRGEGHELPGAPTR